MTPVRAIGFDLWETLITDTPDMSKAQQRLRLVRMEEILVRHGHGALAGRLEHAHREVWHRCHDLYWSRDEDIPCRRQIEHLLEELGLDPRSLSESALSALEDAYATAAVEIPPAVVDGAAGALAALKDRGLGIGLVSNTGRTPGSALREILAQAGLAQFIDVMVFSNEHGVCKPQTSIFDELRRGLGTSFSEMLFVGDNTYVDVYGAQRAGMRAIHFDPPVRGTAVAPHVEAGEEVVPFARVTRLRDVVALVDERMKDEG
ncbi:MAG TPA: HAD family hydrolase [Thermoanaerobaculia bacterium]|nr:HAD family hydrolase [Thermoanaerobaculia bacterium]